MPQPRILCVLTAVLGNKPMAQRLERIVCAMPEITPVIVRAGVEDYAAVPAPWWARATNAWHAQYIIRRKMASVAGPFDALLVNSWEFVTEFAPLARRVPAAAAIDAVPSTVNAQLRQRGATGWKRRLSHQVHHRAFRRAAPAFRWYLPYGSDCADALRQDYGIAENRILVTLAPQDLDVWKPAPAPSAYSGPVRLLWVGNDFYRKGGDTLLELYSRHFTSDCTLTLVSNDPAIANLTLPAGVRWLRGLSRDDVLGIYRESDLFVFPTRQDYMPQVLAEALAVGVPCAASDVGGIRDLVRSGETGILLPPGATAGEWAARVQPLIASAAERDRLSRGARRFAEHMLDIRKFETAIVRVVRDLAGLS